MADRPHTGPKRNDQTRRAILAATQRLLREDGYPALSIGAIARAAGVGRQTIYRWWPSKADVVLEALIEWGAEQVAIPVEGPLPDRLRAFLRDTFRGASDPDAAAFLKVLAAESQRDPEFGERFGAFLAARRAVLASVLAPDVPAERVPLLVDLVFGLLWYRLIVGTAPLDDAAADAVAGLLARAAG
ncbi:putative HTH-type transcriptional regulator [Baekduia alba]|uniref:TetR/AcrR family transcriptional regulator n=1 Tax=Baekduia alba TaxID=2997333 RepID=UPI00234102A6|nr:TetR/AcrR family transcriptional regulator [Baekduia alba]WCB91682.1 putative HTH-type transcriptional regulator [Baekduia alba]